MALPATPGIRVMEYIVPTNPRTYMAICCICVCRGLNGWVGRGAYCRFVWNTSQSLGSTTSFSNTTTAFISEYCHDDCGRSHHSCCICLNCVADETVRSQHAVLPWSWQVQPTPPSSETGLQQERQQVVELVGCDCVYVRVMYVTRCCGLVGQATMILVVLTSPSPSSLPPSHTTHSLTHSHTHLLTHSLTHTYSHTLTHSLTHSLTHPLTDSLTYPLTHSLVHLFSAATSRSLW